MHHILHRHQFNFVLIIISLFFIFTGISFGQIPAGQFLWLRADAGVTTKGSIVTAWKDQNSSISFFPADSAILPSLIQNVIGTFPVVRFRGNAYLEGPPVFPTKQDYTISLVVTISDTNANNNILSGDHHAFWLGQNTYPAVVHSDHFFTQAVSRVGIRSGPNIITVRYSENTQQAILYVNGLFGDSLFVDTNLDSTMYLGSYQRSYFLQGDIAEVLIYKRECTELEREQTEDYLFTKYKLQRPSPLPLPDSTFTEVPTKFQLYPRGQNDSANVKINGTFYQSGFDSIYCIQFKNTIPTFRISQPLEYVSGKSSFTFSLPIHAEMSEYSFRVGVISATKDSILTERDSIVCGDAYLITGQSNAIFGYGDASLNTQNEFCRTFGSIYSKNIRDTIWAFSSANYYGDAPTTVSGWGLQLQKRILAEYKIPTCIINGGYSGNIIEHFEKDSLSSYDLRTIYGRLLFRTTKANLIHAVKAIFWVHGELYSTVESYYSLFKELYMNWRKDFPQLEKIYLGQLRPSYCANIPILAVRDLQRTIEDSLPLIETFALSGLPYQDGCHFHDSGWLAFGDMVYGIVAHDFYHSIDSIGIYSPHIFKAFYTSTNRNEVKLIFRPSGGIIATSDTTVFGIQASLKDYFYFDDSSTKVQALFTNGDTVILSLNTYSHSSKISYIPERFYNNTEIMYEGPWLTSTKGTGALIFYEFPIANSNNDTDKQPIIENLSLEISPNPTNRKVFISYNLPSVEQVKVSIFDILGKEIEKTNQETIGVGNHLLIFNLSNFPDGEYFCRLQAGDKILTKKIIVIK